MERVGKRAAGGTTVSGQDGTVGLVSGVITSARRLIAATLALTLTLQPALVQAQQVTPDIAAPVANQPGVGAAPNGVPLIDIVTPNAQGLSHNKYGNFNVGTPGLILNNYNGEVGTSKLGGVTPGNPNLNGSGPAGVILNEVTGGGRSALNGLTEVFGGRADVIVANPNGITCDGCGFINTPHATLTTGVPDIGGDGRLNGFTVDGGDVTFGAGGGNFAAGDGAVDLFDVVSRTITVNGPVFGKDLHLTAGRNKFDYATGQATALTATSGTPEYAIDGTALGAMQADRIKMVVTDRGAGVRMRADMAANAGELSLSADGKISLGNVSGTQGVAVNSGGRVEAAKIASKARVAVRAADGITLQSVAADGDVLLSGGAGLISLAGGAESLGSLELTAEGDISGGTLKAGLDTHLASTGGDIRLNGDASAGRNLTLSAVSGSINAASLISGNIDVRAGRIKAQNIFGNGSIALSGDMEASGQILGASGISITGATKAGAIVAGVDFKATAASASGKILLGQAGDLHLAAASKDIEVGTFLAAGDIDAVAANIRAQAITGHRTVSLTANIDIDGMAQAASDLSVAGGHINAGAMVSGVDFAGTEASASGEILLGSAGNLHLEATSADIEVGTLLSAGDLRATAAEGISANAVSHKALSLQAGGDIALSGQSRAASDVALTAANVNVGELISGVDFDATDAGAGNLMLAGNGAIAINATQGSVTADNLLSAGDMRVHAVQNIAYNAAQSGADLALASDGGAISLDKATRAGGDIALALQNIDLSNGRSGLSTAGTLKINAQNANLSNSNLTFGGLDLSLTGTADVSNARINTTTASGGTGDLLISASALATNNATKLLAGDDLDLTLASLANYGQLAAGNDLTFNIGSDLYNSPSGLIYAGHDARFYVPGTLTNDQGAIIAGHDLTVAGGAAGQRNGALINHAGLIQSGNDMSITTGYLLNEALTTPAVSQVLTSSSPLSEYDILTRDYDGQPITSSRPVYRNIADDQSVGGANAPALIRAGGNLMIDTRGLTNSHSAIEAGNSLTILGSGVLANQGMQLQRRTWVSCDSDEPCEYYPNIVGEWRLDCSGGSPDGSSSCDYVYVTSELECSGNSPNGSGRCHSRQLTAPNPNGKRDPSKDLQPGKNITSIETIGAVGARINAGGALNILGFSAVNNTSGAGSVAGNIAVAAPSAVTDPTATLTGMTAGAALFSLNAAVGSIAAGSDPAAASTLTAALAASMPKPQSGGFGGTIPGQVFLYETRAEFLDVGKFYGSSYFISRLGYQPDRAYPFLGDAYFENQFIDQQLRMRTGQGLGGNAIDEVKALYDNGIAYAQSHGLTFGDVLSPQAAAALTAPLVLYQKQMVDGIVVLAPTVYLPSTEMAALTPSGALISGNSVSIAGGAVSNSGTIAAKGNLAVSGSSIMAKGGRFKAGGDLTLASAGALTLETQSLDLSGSLSSRQVLGAAASATAGGNVTLSAGSDLTLKAATVSAGGNLAVASTGGSVNIATVETTDRSANRTTTTVTTTEHGSSLSSGGDTTINGNSGVLIAGSKVSAGGDVALASKGDVNVTAVESRTDSAYRQGRTTSSSAETHNQGASIAAGGNLTVEAGHDIAVVGSDLSAGGVAGLAAGNDVTIAEAVDTTTSDFHTKKKGGLFSGSRETTKHSETETAVGSSVSGGAGVAVISGNNTVVSASTLNAGGPGRPADLSIAAGGDIVVASGANTAASSEASKKSGFLSKKSSSGQRYDETTVASELTATGDLMLNAGGQAAVSGSNLAAGSNLAVVGDSVSVAAAEENHSLSQQSKKSGLFAGSGDGFFSIWGKNEKTAADGSTVAVGSNLAAGGDVALVARAGDVSVFGSSVAAGADLLLSAARDVNVTPGAESAFSLEQKKRSGFGIQVSSGSGSASIGIGFGSATDKTSQGTSTNATSTLSAGRDVTIDAGQDANLQAAKVTAGRDADILAANDVNLLSAEDKSNYEELHKQFFAGVSLTVQSSLISAGQNIASAANGLGGDNKAYAIAPAALAAYKAYDALKNIGEGTQPLASASLSAGFSYSKSEIAASSSSPVLTTVNAGNAATLKSGGDTTLAGAVVSGNSVTADVGGDLDIISRQATAAYKEKTLGASLGIDLFSGAVSGGAQLGRIKGDYANVTQQSGIVAGTGGYHVTADGDVELKGGVIASTADPGNNELSANSLTYSDIANSSKTSTSSYGFSLTPIGIPIPLVSQPAKHSEKGETLATLTPGQLTLTNQSQDLSGLNTDLSKANTSVEPFDIDRLKAQQASAAALSELLNIGVGELSKKLGFEEGSKEKIVLHAAVGAIVAKAAGGNIAAGALAGGASEFANGVLQDVLKVNPNLTDTQKSAITQWVAAVVGVAVGGTQGAATALDNVNDNYLTHKQREDLSSELKGCDSEPDPVSCKAAVSQRYIDLDFDQDRLLDACRTTKCVRNLLGDLNENPQFSYREVLELQKLGLNEAEAQRLLAYQVQERWLTGDASTFEQHVMDVAAGVGYCEDHGQSAGCFATGQALKYVSETVTNTAYGVLGLSAAAKGGAAEGEAAAGDEAVGGHPLGSTQPSGAGGNARASISDILLPKGEPVGYVKPGAGQNIQTVTPAQFSQLQSQLMEGSAPVTTPPGYKGTWYQRSDGTVFGLRTSDDSGATIDVIKSNTPSLPSGFKVHQQ